MLYWYVRSVLTDHSKLKRSDFWHFLPMIIFFISAFPNTFVPWRDKVEAAMMAVENQEYLMVYKASLLNRIIPTVAIYLFRLVLVLGYTIGAGVLFIKYLKKKQSYAVFSKQHFMKKWLCCLLGFLFILAVSQVFMVIKSFEMHFSELFFTFNILRVISVAGLIGLLISPFFFPTILYGLPRMPETNEQENDDSQIKERKQRYNSFESDYLKSISQKTDSFMQEHQLYLEPDCNLAYFSKQINIPTHHLAYYFREVKKQHFNDFRNEWRINHAKALIKEGKANEITLEAIGSLSGFSSRNTFITDFKKLEGESPGTYAARFY
ncbi:helix-turn-helix domain-containing protein [Sunxiuqinia sp. A32]|uniref:helix-turn-helix domain-containing protein n=1 Tax=Sunxiuqinia sp. A32 TaxID=3461496 RepID=UPI0040453C3B